MFRLLCLAVILGLPLAAASPVAKITSGEPFILSGTRVPVAGIPNWPLVAGDEVVTAKAPGRIDFADGSRVYVMPNSKIKITVESGRTVVRLEEGALSYTFAKDSTAGVAARSNGAISKDSREGRLLLDGSDAFWNPANPEFFQMGGLIRRENGGLFFGQYRLTPFNLDFILKWREYDPQWGVPLGGQPGSQVVPPGGEILPPQPAPTSNWKP